MSSESAYSAMFKASVYISMDLVQSPSLNKSFPSPKRWHTRSLMKTYGFTNKSKNKYVCCNTCLQVSLRMSSSQYSLTSTRWHCFLPHTLLDSQDMVALIWGGGASRGTVCASLSDLIIYLIQLQISKQFWHYIISGIAEMEMHLFRLKWIWTYEGIKTQ